MRELFIYALALLGTEGENWYQHDGSIYGCCPLPRMCAVTALFKAFTASPNPAQPQFRLEAEQRLVSTFNKMNGTLHVNLSELNDAPETSFAQIKAMFEHAGESPVA